MTYDGKLRGTRSSTAVRVPVFKTSAVPAAGAGATQFDFTAPSARRSGDFRTFPQAHQGRFHG
jgi:hypothetical protein